MAVQTRLFGSLPQDEVFWDAYVAQHPNSTGDHRWGWRRVLKNAFGFEPFYLGAFKQQALVGILPLFRIPRGFGSVALSSIPFGNYGGVCAQSAEAEQSLIQAALVLRDKMGAAYVELRHTQSSSVAGLYAHELYSRFSMPVSDPEEHWRTLGRNERNKINRAARIHMRVVDSKCAEDIYAVHLDTVKRLGTPCFPMEYFQLILDEFKQDTQIKRVTYEAKVIAYVILIRFKQSLLVQFNGSLGQYLNLKPNNLLFWHALLHACEHGLKELDYGRSRKGTGTAAFKQGMGLQAQPLGYQYAFSRGHAVAFRNPASKQYQWAMRTWKKLPLQVTRLLGPKLVRYFA